MVKIAYKRLLNLILVLMWSCLLQGCAYSGKFSCPDSKGATCVMLSRVDQMVDSGEIEKYHISKNDKGCLLGKCNSEERGSIDSRPKIANSEVIKARILDADESVEYIEGDYLYVK